MKCSVHLNTELDEENRCGWCVLDDQLEKQAAALRAFGEATVAKSDELEVGAHAPGKLREALDELRTAALKVRHHAATWDSLLKNTRRNGG